MGAPALRALRYRAHAGAERRPPRSVSRAPPAMKRELGRNALHLGVLSSFAIAEPLLDLLGRTPEFFVVRGSTAGDVIFFALVLTFAPPLALLLVEAVVGRFSVVAMRWLHHLFVAAL